MKKQMDYSKEKNSLRVELENFQSISKASLEFVQGINLIVGQSNSGKSAIFRAIKGAVLNPSGSQKYIKNGTKGFKVGLEYEGNSIEWSRDSKSPKYKVNGEDYLKVGGSNLTNLVDNSGFVLDDGKSLMNMESELELPFPFDKNSSELFKLFEKNIFCVSDSTTIVKYIKSDEDDVSRQKDNAEYELNRYKQKLSAIEELEQEVDLNKLIQGRQTLSTMINDKEKLVVDINKLHDMIVMGDILSTNIPPVEVNTDICNEYTTLQADILKLDEIRGVGSVLQTTPTASTPSTIDLNGYLELKSDIETLEEVEKVTVILRPLEAPTTRLIDERYTSLRNDINTLSNIRQQAQNVHKAIEEQKELITRLEAEKKEFKVCPLCGGPIGEK